MAFAIKHRPSTWDQVVGHDLLIASIKSNISGQGNNGTQSFMFTGQSGVGKTTVARILAKALGAVGDGILEINSANYRGIDDARGIIDNSEYVGIGSHTKVYILDECQQMTREAQNAFLKALEKGSSGVCFILISTDVEKVIPAIRTRCKTYDFKPVHADIVKSLLVNIAKGEGLQFKDSIIDLVVKKASGSPRYALNMLEKCVPYADDFEQAKALLQSEFINFGCNTDTSTAMKIIDMIYGSAEQDCHSNLSNLIKQLMSAGEFNPAGLKEGLILSLGKLALNNNGESLLDMVLFLERHRDVYTMYGFAVVLLKMAKLVHG